MCGKNLPWVKRADHLGHVIHEDGTMRQDCVEKRGRFIDESCKIRETFNFAHPEEKLAAVEKYCCSMYGSNLWDLRSREAEMVFNSWKTSVKLAFDVHRGCRTYLLQKVLAPDLVSLRVNLLTRFRGFFRRLIDSPSHEVQLVALLSARDIRSSLGSNLTLLRDETGLDPWVVSPGQLKQALIDAEKVEVPSNDEWRIHYLKNF